MDETYIGGKRRGVRRRPPAGDLKKKCVVGVVERKGRVVAVTANDATRETLHGIAKERILPESTVFTDTLSAYDGLDKVNGYIHHRGEPYFPRDFESGVGAGVLIARSSILWKSLRVNGRGSASPLGFLAGLSG